MTTAGEQVADGKYARCFFCSKEKLKDIYGCRSDRHSVIFSFV
jgi:hypothetical protein